MCAVRSEHVVYVAADVSYSLRRRNILNYDDDMRCLTTVRSRL